MGMTTAVWSLNSKHFIAEPESPLGHPMDLHWEDTPDWVLHNSPEWLRRAGQSRRRVLPLVQLWGSPHVLLVLGFNQHGVPGVYFTQPLTN